MGIITKQKVGSRKYKERRSAAVESEGQTSPPDRASERLVSRQLPLRSTATSRLHRPCRSSHSLHCISAAPAALDRYLAASPAMSLIPVAPFADKRALYFGDHFFVAADDGRL